MSAWANRLTHWRQLRCLCVSKPTSANRGAVGPWDKAGEDSGEFRARVAGSAHGPSHQPLDFRHRVGSYPPPRRGRKVGDTAGSIVPVVHAHRLCRPHASFGPDLPANGWLMRRSSGAALAMRRPTSVLPSNGAAVPCHGMHRRRPLATSMDVFRAGPWRSLGQLARS